MSNILDILCFAGPLLENDDVDNDHLDDDLDDVETNIQSSYEITHPDITEDSEINHTLVVSNEDTRYASLNTEHDHDANNANSEIKLSICEKIKVKIVTLYQSILLPHYFLIFNILCALQAIPALYYYISFFKRGFIVSNSTGMPPVWGATIGSIGATIVTSALGPLPPGLITRPFAMAVIIWKFVITSFVFIATVCLGIQGDYLAVIWGSVCTFSAGASAVLLLWLGLNIEQVRADRARKYGLVAAVDDVHATAGGDVEMRNIYSATSNNNVVNRRTEVNSSGKVPPTSSMNSIFIRIVQCLLWIILFVFYLIPIGFGIDQAMKTREKLMYTQTGERYSVSSSHNSTDTIRMHLTCTGPENSTRPTIFIESDSGTSGFAYYSLQNTLSDSVYNWRVCVYDRPGYGWSDMSSLGSTVTVNVISRIHRLLDISGETSRTQGKFLFVGHGSGGEIMQIYAAQYPSSVAGLVLLDAYPAVYRMRGYSAARIKTDSTELCGNYQILRVMESVAYARPVNDYYFAQAENADAQFVPSAELNRYKSTFSNGKYYASMYNDFCLHPHGFVLNTDHLNRLSTSTASNAAATIHWSPLVPNVPVLIVVASQTVVKDEDASLYYEQSIAYNSTLSPTGTSKWILCDDCQHSFPIDKNSVWLAQQLHSYFIEYV